MNEPSTERAAFYYVPKLLVRRSEFVTTWGWGRRVEGGGRKEEGGKCVQAQTVRRRMIRVYWIFRHLQHFYADDLIIKLHCSAGFMRKVHKVPEDSILAYGTTSSKNFRVASFRPLRGALIENNYHQFFFISINKMTSHVAINSLWKIHDVNKRCTMPEGDNIFHLYRALIEPV